MKKILLYAFYLSTISVYGQTDPEIVEYIDKNLPRLSFGYIIFFEPELIECCEDSVHRKEFASEIVRQKERMLHEEMNKQKERKVFLHVLYNRINETKPNTSQQKEAKQFLMNQLSDFKNLEFKVDEAFMMERLNPNKRGIVFGDEECDIDFSYYVFFLYDLQLYMKVIKNNKVINPSGEIKFPVACYLEELSNVPVKMKKRVQNELLKMLNKYKGDEFEFLRNKIKGADLNSSLD